MLVAPRIVNDVSYLEEPVLTKGLTYLQDL